ncbi:MAG: serine hydrolase [Proteobacteria bacterium]|nr:serine hydrolase [Pseudomonadota bacterium]
MLVGCTVHGDPSLATYLPAAYGVSLAFPWGDAKAKSSAWKPTAPAPRALDQAIRGITGNFEGLVGVAVTSIDDGWIVAANGERPMPQQSVSKLWVAMTVLDQVDQGRIRLEDPITITRADFTLFHQPVAALVKGDAGYTASVGEIIRRAMQMSDNTCNDKLLRLVGGPDAVRSFLARKGITGVRFGPGEKLLQAGTAVLVPEQPNSDIRITDFLMSSGNPVDIEITAFTIARLSLLLSGTSLPTDTFITSVQRPPIETPILPSGTPLAVTFLNNAGAPRRDAFSSARCPFGEC